MEIDALVTGESVAQVSSQTLRNLALIDQVCNKLILRPLATMNKPEIINIASEIGTKHFAENMPEYCGVISQNPITHGSFKRMEKVAQKFNYDVLHKAVQEAQYLDIDQIVEDIEQLAPVEVVHDIQNDKHTVIDIRPEDECIELACETLKIPFHKLKVEFEKLPQDREYLLYCDKGIMSQLHAQYLRDAKNITNVSVYRPR
jgi:thiamine biosynthesis protein ThiI